LFPFFHPSASPLQSLSGDFGNGKYPACPPKTFTLTRGILRVKIPNFLLPSPQTPPHKRVFSSENVPIIFPLSPPEPPPLPLRNCAKKEKIYEETDLFRLNMDGF